MLLTLRVLAASSLILAGGVRTEAATASYAFGTPGVTVEATALRQTVSGVTVRVRGYVAESRTAAVPVFGPFPTGPGAGGFRVFGVDLQNGAFIGRTALGVLPQPIGSIHTSGADVTGGNISPFFDNRAYLVGNKIRKIDFAVFEFSQNVSVKSMTTQFVDCDSIWFAWSATAPVFGNGLVNAIKAMKVRLQYCDGFNRTVFPINANNARYLIVGAAPYDFDIGPVRRDPRRTSVNFYISNIKFN
ncbi:MAG: hypothetical protein WAS21_26800 [Geminicoccaceae bacterium]